MRKTRIRKVKNDKVDSLLICEALSLGYYNLLSNYDIELKQLASRSVGINNSALCIQIKMTIELIELLESQIKDIEKQVSEFIKKNDNVITSIPGIVDTTAAIIISEIGDINCFNNPSQVLAFAGLDPSIKQSDTFNASSTRMSKRGSSLLRYALILAANNVQLNTKTFSNYYNTKRAQGKLHYNALGHCAGKLVRTIFYMLKNNVKFNLDQFFKEPCLFYCLH